jgi:hypothetical protein
MQAKSWLSTSIHGKVVYQSISMGQDFANDQWPPSTFSSFAQKFSSMSMAGGPGTVYLSPHHFHRTGSCSLKSTNHCQA